MFSIDGKFFRTLTKIGDFLILGVLGIIFSIPVFTVGASATAMLHTGMKLVKDEESYVFREFWRSWKSNFKQSLGVEIILGIIAFFLITDIRICSMWASKEGSLFASLLIYAFLGLLLVLAAVAIYAFPLLAKFENTVKGTLKNALLLCMKHLPQTFIMLIFTVGLSYFSLGYFPVFVLTIPIICYVDSYIIVRIFKPYVEGPKEEGAETEDTNSEDTYAEDTNAENTSEAVSDVKETEAYIKSDDKLGEHMEK